MSDLPKLPTLKTSLHVTARDLAVLAALHKYRLLERAHIQRMFFMRHSRSGNLPWTIARLKGMYEAGLVERIQRKGWWGRPTPGPVYRLAKKGAELLAQQAGLPGDRLLYYGQADDGERRPTWVGPGYIEHALQLADVRMQIEAAAEKSGCTIEKWLDQVDLRPSWKTERVGVELKTAGVRESVAITPDGYFSLVSGKGRGHFFLEVDRGTEVVCQHWRRKTLAYKEYWRSGQFHQRYGEADRKLGFSVLALVPSVKRLESIKAAAENYGPAEDADLFLIARLEQMGPDILTAPIWARGGFTEAQVLL